MRIAAAIYRPAPSRSITLPTAASAVCRRPCEALLVEKHHVADGDIGGLASLLAKCCPSIDGHSAVARRSAEPRSGTRWLGGVVFRIGGDEAFCPPVRRRGYVRRLSDEAVAQVSHSGVTAMRLCTYAPRNDSE
jgi:hypothetical protein